MKKITSFILLFVLVLTLAACSSGSSSSLVTSANDTAGTTSDTQQSSSAASSPITVNYDDDDLNTSAAGSNAAVIKLEGNAITFEGVGATVSGSVITITYAGDYVISGSLDDGQVIVDTESAETVHLILDGASITSTTSAPIYIRKADKVVITLADGTQNYVTDGTSHVLEAGSDEPDAAVFSKSDLTINGNGALTVSANYDDGITSKDDLKIISGSLTVSSVGDAIRGRDSISIDGGTFTISAGADGMQSNNDEDPAKGYVAITGGTFNIAAGNDGIQAETSLAISGGDFNITTGGGSVNGTHAGQGDWGGKAPAASTTSASAESTKGLKAGVALTVTGGTFTIDAADDTLHSNDILTVSGGSFQLSSGDDGLHADTTLTVNSGEITIVTSYEGIESQTITINDGTIHLAASDDGINGSDGSGSTGAFPGQGGMESATSSMFIHGGYIYVDANGDGIDINGPIEMTAGVVIVNGPTNNGNGAIDYTGSFVVTGGFLVAAGSAGMAQAPSDSSTLYAVMHTFQSAQAAGQVFHVQTANGEEILTFTPTKTYQSVVFCMPELQKGETYLVFSGGSSTGTATDGLYTGGTYSGGTQVASYTLSSIITGSTGSGFPMGPGGRPRP